MSVRFLYLCLLVGIVLLVFVPIFFVVRAARRRKRAIDSGELILADTTNTLSIIGFVLSFFGAIVGIVLGHVALSQIKHTNERGWGLAVAALWIGYASVFVGGVLVVAAILVGMSLKG